MKRSRRMRQLMYLLTLIAIALVGCTTEQSMFDIKGPVAKTQLDLLWLSVWVMTFVTVVVVVITIFVLIRYRERKGQTEEPKQTAGNKWVELFMVLIPAILITILAIPTVTVSYELADETRVEDELDVIVIGKQFWWEFQYPELGIVTANEMHIPVGAKIHIQLESPDVVHAFWVPKLGGKVDNIPGRTNYMWLQADEPGIYSGQCAEYCGSSHALMAFQVIAHEPEDFENWIQQMKNPQTEPQSDLAAEGEQIFQQSCASCHAIEGTDYTGVAGPDLTGFGNRNKLAAGILDNNRENLKAWLMDPMKIKPGNLMIMPEEINEREAEALAEYLLNLK